MHPSAVVPLVQLLNTGAVAVVQVKVLVQVLVCPQAVAVYVNACERALPVGTIVPGVHITGTDPHSLLAVMV